MSGSVRVHWLGHASVVLDLPGVRVLTDPLLLRHAGLLRRDAPVPRPDDWAGADAVLVSHLHHDHAELGSLRKVPGVPVLTAPTNAWWLRRHGVAAARGVPELRWWRHAERDLRVLPVPALHGDRPMPHRPNHANGFVVVAGGVRVWFAGDTARYPAMSDLPALAGGPVDLALVPVGGWGPRLSGGHMDAVEAARACAVVGARAAVPVHWGTLHAPASGRLPPGWMQTPGPAFAAALAREAPGCAAVVVAPGGSAWTADAAAAAWSVGG